MNISKGKRGIRLFQACLISLEKKSIQNGYTFEKDYILFYPDKYDTFEVYAHRNPALGDTTTKMVFVGFQDDKTFVQFNQDSVQQVFNNDAQLFRCAIVHQIDKNTAEINFYARYEQEDTTFVFWSPYEDNRYLRKYMKQQLQHNDSIGFDKGHLSHGSIFFTTCEDVERSYHYRNERGRQSNR